MTVFISYNRRDAAHARALDDWLRAQGETTFFDQRDLGGGQLWLDDLERAIGTTATAVAVLVGPNGLGNTQKYEFQFALTRQTGEPGFPVIPVILPGTPLAILTGFIGLQTWVDFSGTTSPLGDPAGLQHLLAATRRLTPGSENIRGTVCPYKGLNYFTEDDAPIFFGRDDEAAALRDLVLKQDIAAVLGRSGAGKSSLVRAGLMPRLRQRDGDHRTGIWDQVLIRPGEDPLLGLATGLAPPGPDGVAVADTKALERDKLDLRDASSDFLATHFRLRREASRLAVNRLLVIVDQAEELFTPPWHMTDRDAIRQFESDRDKLISLLLTAADQRLASVVLTVRSDFFDALMHSPFGPRLSNAQLLLGRIQDLTPVIERPAGLVGMTLATGLTRRVVDDVGTDETNLPLMQHALESTWRKIRSGTVLTHEAYEEAGGVSHAINKAAEDCYRDDLRDDQERLAAQRLFLRVVRPGSGDTILRVQANVPDDPVEKHVMEVFADPHHRLLLVGAREGTPTVELSHEALARGWTRLRDWVRDERDNLRARELVREWMADNPNGILPLDSALFVAARAWITKPGNVLPDSGAEAYVRRSIQAVEARERAEREAIEHQLAAVRAEAQRERERRTVFGVASVVFLAVAVAAGIFYFKAERNADEAARQTGIAKDETLNARGARQDAENALAEAKRQSEEAQRQAGVAEEQRRIAEEQGRIAAEQRDFATEQQTIATAERDRAAREAARANAAAGAARDAASRLIFDIAQNLADQQGVPVPTRSRILTEAMTVLDGMLRFQSDDPALLRMKAVASGVFSGAYEALGDTAQQRAMAEQSVAMFQRLGAREPGNTQHQRDLSVSFDRVGNVLVAQGRGEEALTAYRDSLAIRERLARADPANARWQRDLSISFEKVGDVLVAQGTGEEALTAYRDSLAIRERLARADPANAGWQRDLSVSFEKVGDVLVAQGKGEEALSAYRDSLAIAERLARADPANAGWQRDLSVSFNKVGDVLVAQGKGEEALTAYRDSLAIADRLARADPANAGWQRGLSVSFEKVGNVLVAQRKGEEALVAYRDSLAIADRLARADPANASWQRDLSVAFEKVGDVLVAQGKGEEALAAYRDSLAIIERLVRVDPGNAGWQRHLAVSQFKLGVLALRSGDVAEARRLLTTGRAIVAGLAARSPDWAVVRRDVEVFDRFLGMIPR